MLGFEKCVSPGYGGSIPKFHVKLSIRYGVGVVVIPFMLDLREDLG